MEKKFIVYWSARGNTVVSGKNKKDAVENNDLFAEDVEVKDFVSVHAEKCCVFTSLRGL